MISLPLGSLESNGSLNFYVQRPVFDRLVVILSQAYDSEEMAKSVANSLHAAACVAMSETLDRIVDELPLGQFRGWNAPERGGSDGSTPPAA